MRWIHRLALALTVACLGLLATQQGAHARAQSLAGWFGAFPILANYQHTFRTPVVSNPQVYRQRAVYQWTGNADRRWDIVLMRDAGAVSRYRAAKPTSITNVKGHVAYLWNLEHDAGSSRDRVRWRLVIFLGKDALVLLEARGLGPFEGAVDLAQSFDLKAMAQALATPPRMSFGRAVKPFRALHRGASYALVTDWVGFADGDIGSGIHVMVYNLPDGSRILLGFPDFDHLLYADHVRKDGTAEHLIP